MTWPTPGMVISRRHTGFSLARLRKCHFDAADWLPPVNRCWFASRIVAVKRKYLLTVDRREAVALERVLSDSSSTDMVFANEALPARISAASTASLCIRASLDL